MLIIPYAVWRGVGRDSGVDKDMNFTVETAPYRITLLSKMLNRTALGRTTLYVRLSRFVEIMQVVLLCSNCIHPVLYDLLTVDYFNI